MENHLIPTRILGPIIQEWLDAYEVGEMESGGQAERSRSTSALPMPSMHPVGKLRILSDISGLPQRTIYGVLHKVRHCEFTTADKLICATVGPHAWFTTDLAPYYADPDLGRSESPQGFPKKAAAA